MVVFEKQYYEINGNYWDKDIYTYDKAIELSGTLIMKSIVIG